MQIDIACHKITALIEKRLFDTFMFAANLLENRNTQLRVQYLTLSAF